ncbi:MAG: branched-chain amino acid ABC transporter permease, partial [Acidimicrobiia bacterium]
AVAWGGWVALAGAAGMLVGAVALPDDRPEPVPPWPLLARPVELLAVAGAMGGALGMVWWGLEIEESSRFTSYVAFATFASVALSRLGVFEWLLGLFVRHRSLTVGAAGLTAALFPFTQGGDAYWLRVFASVGVFAAAAIGLNVVVGLAGLLDLGYVAFFGVGAYAGGLLGGAGLSTLDIHLPFLLVVLLGALISAAFGVVIGAPTLRLRGDYLAIVTLGFGEIFRIAAFNSDDLTRGPNGIGRIPDLEIAGFNLGERHELFGVELSSFANYYLAELILLAGVILVFSRLNDSRIGRAWVAIREDETAAAAMGVDTVRMKLLAFAIGAFMAGAAGTVNAHVVSQVVPGSYEFEQSIFFVAAVVLGGMGTVPGALLGSALLFVIPEKLRAFQDKRFLLFGVALVIMMRFRPEGLVPSRRRQRELHDASGADALSAPPGGTL